MENDFTSKVTSLFRQLIAFIGVGAVATAVDYAVFLCGFFIFGVDPIVAALAGYAVGGVISYGLSRKHVFKSERSHRSAALRFMAVMAGGFLLTGYAMRIFVDGLQLAPIVARILTYGVVLVFNFLTHRFFTFGR
jgi:putative flippase GtrA